MSRPPLRALFVDEQSVRSLDASGYSTDSGQEFMAKPTQLSIPPPPPFSSQVHVQSPTPKRAWPPPLTPSTTLTAIPKTPGKPGNVSHELSRMPPDEMFSRLSIYEIKTLQSKLRGEADSKQEELRTMVGERYRDLLQASTSIISISDTSKRVVDELGHVHDACLVHQDRSIHDTKRPKPRPYSVSGKVTGDDAQLTILQSLSAHLKLLLDAPEQLWRLLERQKFLQAAWLFLVARVVYRSLSRDSSEVEEGMDIVWENEDIFIDEQFPLVQRQWDTVSQFRHQITHKATQNLRNHARSSQETCETLLSILLLDSLPLSEILSLLLAQRSKTLKTAYSKLAPTTASSSATSPLPASRPPSPFSADRKQNREMAAALLSPRSLSPSPQLGSGGEKLDSAELRRRRREVITLVRESVSQILNIVVGTVETVRDVFSGGEHRDGASLPLMESMLAAIQLGAAAAPQVQSSSSTRPTTVVTTQSILHALPSSQLLIQFLPQSITSFTPYIDTTSPSSLLPSPLPQTSAWFNGCLSSLEGKLRSWLEDLGTVRDVCAARSVVGAYKDRFSGEEMGKLQSVVDEVCKERIRSIWTRELRRVERGVEEVVDGCVKELRDGGDIASASDPSTFFLSTSSPIFPSSAASVSSGSSGVTSPSHFKAYRKNLDARLSMHTPLLDVVLRQLERSARRLKKDLSVLIHPEDGQSAMDGLMKEYTPTAVQSAMKIARALHARLGINSKSDSVGDNSDLVEKKIAVDVFLGRVAYELATSSSFLQNLCPNADISAADVRAELAKTQELALSRWQARAVTETLATCSAHFTNSIPETSPLTPTPTPSRPSITLTTALSTMLNHLERLSIPHLRLQTQHISRSLVHVVFRGILGIVGREHVPNAQVQWDLAFLSRLCDTFGEDGKGGEWKREWNKVIKWIKSQRSDAQDVFDITSDATKASIEQHLARVQLSLGPLVGPSSSPAPLLAAATASTTPNFLLPLGAPPAEHSLYTLMDVVKPGPRFGMLLVGSTVLR